MTHIKKGRETLKLGELKKGKKARIVRVGAAGGDESMSVDIVTRLLEMGLLEGSMVEIIHEAPFGGDPVAVRVRGSLIALRRQEANTIEVVCE